MIDVQFEFDTPRVFYGDFIFVRLCPVCAKFVKADDTLEYEFNKWTEEARFNFNNATCKTHGRVAMIFEGYGGDY